MERGAKPTNANVVTSRPQATVEIVPAGDVALLNVVGLVDERFKGFGTVGESKSVVINASGITRMTSFGVRQWLNAMDALPKDLSEVLLLGCPTFFVDQLNMVLNFGGSAKVLTVVAPYTCPSCGIESGETIDVLAERANLANGGIPEKECARCGGKLEFDETPESYFSFVGKYAASSIRPATAQLLAEQALYTAVDVAAENPPRIIKLVEGSVTYFRIIGRIGSMFRARPFLVGAEGEVVIDLAEVEAFDRAAHNEWRRLLKNLSDQDIVVTVVDAKEPFFVAVGDTLAMPNIKIETLVVPYVCIACNRRSQHSKSMRGKRWPPHFDDGVCTTCGGVTRQTVAGATLVHLKKASTDTPEASAQVIEHRAELLERAMTDANLSLSMHTPPPTAATADAILGKYKIVRRLPSRGVAEVFLAKQLGIGGFEKPIVLKKLQASMLEQRERAVEQFLNEVKLAGRLTHPNIVQILDVGEVDGALYLAMEYVNGKNLREVIDHLERTNTVMPVAEACYIAREVANALEHAYWSTDMRGEYLGVVHGDVSPHNIMLSYDGTVKVLNFGVSTSLSEQADAQYIAPEAATGRDHRSDLFSVGVLLYQLCSGAKLFAGSSPKSAKRRNAGKHRPLHEVATVPASLSSLVAGLLSPNVEERPQRGQEVVAELIAIARRSSIESSGSNIAKFLTQLFPEQAASWPDETPTVETAPVPSDTKPPTNRSTDSISIARTRSGRQPGIDASVSFVGRPRDLSVPPKNVTRLPKLALPTPPRWSSWLIRIVISAVLIAAGVYLFIAHGT